MAVVLQRGRRLVTLLALTLVASVAPSTTGSADVDERNTSLPPPDIHNSAIIDNGVVQLGINDEGHLNLYSPELGRFVGVRSLATGNEATAPGCLCEGWGAADAVTGVSGYANISSDGGAHNMTPLPFESTADSAVATVRIGEALQVVHDFHPSVNPNLYEVRVTITNISAVEVRPLYRRVMDWDVEPTPFNEFVTIAGDSPNLLGATNGGFDSANPLQPRTGTPAPFTDLGPDDHGALFDFGFDPLAAGDSVSFNIYYGVAPTENDALVAVDFVGATVYSLGQPSTPTGATNGDPNTFIFAFGAVGGAPLSRLPVRKSADQGISAPGAANGYSIVLSNPTDGPVTVNSVIDTLPEGGFVYTPGSSTMDGAAIPDPVVEGGTDLVWPGPFTLASKTTRTLHFGVTVPEDTGEYFNQATADAVDADGNPVPARATGPAARIVVPPPDITSSTSSSSTTGTPATDAATGLPAVRMRAGGRSDLTLTSAVTCPGGSAPTSVDLSHNGGTYPMTEGPAGTWVGTIPASGVGEGPVDIVAVCDSVVIPNTVLLIVLYDPSGIVSDAVTGAPVSGATILLYKVPFALPDSGGATGDCRTVDTRPGSDWSGVAAPALSSGVLADTTLTPAEISPLINPQITGADGRYGWDVAIGCWFVKAEAPGYLPRISALVGVPPEVTDLDLALAPVPTGPKCPGLESDPRSHLVGTAGNDKLNGTAGAEVICGLGGNDTIKAGGGDDLVLAGPGVDYVDAGAGNDVVFGGADNDQLVGGDGLDQLFGEAGNDILNGGPGADLVNGGLAADKCLAGAGDTFELCP